MKTLLIEMVVTDTGLEKDNEYITNDLDTTLNELDQTGTLYTRLATFPNPEIDGQTVIIAVAV